MAYLKKTMEEIVTLTAETSTQTTAIEETIPPKKPTMVSLLKQKSAALTRKVSTLFSKSDIAVNSFIDSEDGESVDNSTKSSSSVKPSRLTDSGLAVDNNSSFKILDSFDVPSIISKYKISNALDGIFHIIKVLKYPKIILLQKIL